MILSVVVVNVVISSVVVVVVVVLVALQYETQMTKLFKIFISQRFLFWEVLILKFLFKILKSRRGKYEKRTHVEAKEKHDYFTREVYYRNRGLWTRVHTLSNWLFPLNPLTVPSSNILVYLRCKYLNNYFSKTFISPCTNSHWSVNRRA